MNENRHPAGTSLGGQWAPGSAAEVDDITASVADDWIIVDEDDPAVLDGDDVLSSVEVSRLDDDLYVHAKVDEHFHGAIPEETAQYFDDDGKNQYIAERDGVISDFLEANYAKGTVMPDIRADGDGNIVGVDFTTGIHSDHGGVNESEVYDVAYSTSAPRFYNEMDPGTDGSPNMQRELREKFEEYDQTPLPPVDVDLDDRADFIRGFTSTMAEDHQQRFNDENFDSDVEVDLKDAEFKAKVEAQAANFLETHSGDLNYLATAPRSDQNWNSLGADAYLEASRGGTGYGDRQSAKSPEVIVAERLSRSADGHFSPKNSSIDFEGSVTVDEDGSIVQ